MTDASVAGAADRSADAPAGSRAGTVGIFSAAIFVAAALLFVVQPMVGKMVLPRLGGSPEVWNTSMVFFQVALLAGYAYAHLSVGTLGVRRQMLMHAGVLLLPVLVLPIALPEWSAPGDGWQSPWLLGLLAVAVGAPFFSLASASPLLQKWFTATRHEAAEDPYFLYASSNAGSLLGLLAYPLVVEPLLPIEEQSRFWSVGYAAFVVLAGLCAALTLRSPGGGGEPETEGPEERSTRGRAAIGPDAPSTGTGGGSPSIGDRLLWLACAFVPSSLLLAVTHHLTTDVAPVPLLWVVPLALYLGTFIVAFSRRRILSIPRLSRFMAIAGVVLALVMLAGIRDPAWAMVLVHLGVLAIAGLLCHGRLAEHRPPTSHLTEFYLLVAAGGALGGIFNALIAPHLFDGLLEYPIAIVLACFLRPKSGEGSEEHPVRARAIDVGLPAGLALLALLPRIAEETLGGIPDGVIVVATIAVPALILYLASRRRLRFALGVASLLGVAYFAPQERGEILHEERTFFGVYEVAVDPEGRFRTLFHGTTVHGTQGTGPDGAEEPLGYYHRSGPAGDVMTRLANRPGAHIGLVGMGTGALAALADPSHRLTFFEIDPAVVRIAENPRYFTYLAETSATYETVVGDGRLALAERQDRFDLLVLDAFSSASIPVHLLTREAIELYVDRLKPDGALLFHISSRHLDLASVLGALARDLDLAAVQRYDLREDEDQERGILSSGWVLMARQPEHLAPLVDERWRPLGPAPETPVWRDDFSNILSAYRWN